MRMQRTSSLCGHFPVMARGLCNKCYQRQRRGSLRVTDITQGPNTTCGHKPYGAHGLCKTCYLYMYRNCLKHRLSQVEWVALRERAKGLCEICGKKGRINLAVDHDHRTGKVRGLLCLRCNRGIALFLDQPNLLKRAASYLRGYRR